MLRGKRAETLGFHWQDGAFIHSAFDSSWQCQSIQYQQDGLCYGLFSAFYIADSISEAEITCQKNLVRVLSHELRNSLTPMASMADTLLSAPQFSPEQVRMVLGRIQQRSERLLKFIQQYAQLSHLPKPQPSRFEFRPILDEAIALLQHKAEINFHGESRCFADPEQFSQLLINLLKNAAEACQKEQVVIDVSLFHCNQIQHLRITDNGEGFANLENVLVPFYTTKSDGSGIGLALCAEIARHHGGELKPSNSERGGASVEISWPLNIT